MGRGIDGIAVSHLCTDEVFYIITLAVETVVPTSSYHPSMSDEDTSWIVSLLVWPPRKPVAESTGKLLLIHITHSGEKREER